MMMMMMMAMMIRIMIIERRDEYPHQEHFTITSIATFL